MSGLWRAPDGVRIFYEDQPGPAEALPVVCLPGLTRGARDFTALAAHLAGARRVIRPEMRGRGRSGRADPATYALPVEVGDILGLLASLGVA
ncbi:MAG: alpha/beta hydrolase, partial [Rhodobacterales bacterium CG_4_10_14_0_8_um_filter_70_9]